MESNYSIGNIPVSENSDMGFRTNVSSNKYNKNQNEKLNDILNLYNIYNSLENKCDNIIGILSCENLFLRKEIDSLQVKLDNLKNNLSGDTAIKYINIYGKDTTAETNPANIDIITSNITMTPNTSTSKLRIETDTKDFVLVPLSFDYKLNEYENKHILKVEDNDFKKCLNDDLGDIFTRKVTTDNTVNSVELEITITLPEKSVTTFDINEISLYPFPSNTYSLNNISYRISHGAWNVIPSFESHSRYVDDKIPNCSPIKFNFKNIEANQIKINITQDNYIEEEEYRIFYIGLKKLDIRSCSYTNTNNNFEFEINIPNNIEKPMLINIEEVYNNYPEIEAKSVQYEFFYYDDEGLLHSITDSMPFKCPKNKIIAKCKMFFNHSSTPNIERFKVYYQEME